MAFRHESGDRSMGRRALGTPRWLPPPLRSRASWRTQTRCTSRRLARWCEGAPQNASAALDRDSSAWRRLASSRPRVDRDRSPHYVARTTHPPSSRVILRRPARCSAPSPTPLGGGSPVVHVPPPRSSSLGRRAGHPARPPRRRLGRGGTTWKQAGRHRYGGHSNRHEPLRHGRRQPRDRRSRLVLLRHRRRCRGVMRSASRHREEGQPLHDRPGEPDRGRSHDHRHRPPQGRRARERFGRFHDRAAAARRVRHVRQHAVRRLLGAPVGGHHFQLQLRPRVPGRARIPGHVPGLSHPRHQRPVGARAARQLHGLPPSLRAGRRRDLRRHPCSLVGLGIVERHAGRRLAVRRHARSGRGGGPACHRRERPRAARRRGVHRPSVRLAHCDRRAGPRERPPDHLQLGLERRLRRHRRHRDPARRSVTGVLPPL